MQVLRGVSFCAGEVILLDFALRRVGSIPGGVFNHASFTAAAGRLNQIIEGSLIYEDLYSFCWHGGVTHFLLIQILSNQKEFTHDYLIGG